MNEITQNGIDNNAKIAVHEREALLAVVHESMADDRSIYVRLHPPDRRGYDGAVVGRALKLGSMLVLLLDDKSTFAIAVSAIASVSLLPKAEERGR